MAAWGIKLQEWEMQSTAVQLPTRIWLSICKALMLTASLEKRQRISVAAPRLFKSVIANFEQAP